MAKTITITVPDVHVERIKEKFREVLGRDLTPEEKRYLGLASTAISIAEFEDVRQSVRRKFSGLKKFKTA